MAASSTSAQVGFRMPAEWEPHAATWLTWPCSQDWPGKLAAVRWTFCEMARLLTRNETVSLIVQDGTVKRAAAKALTQAGVDVAKVYFFESKTDRTWARDNLPTFVTHDETHTLGAVKWRFNGWARYEDHELDEAAGMAVAKATVRREHLFVPKYQLGKKTHRFVLEGGSIDVDGEGTVLTTRRCLLGEPFARNPGLSQSAVEEVLRDNLGVSSVLWVEDGIAGDDTSGHIDDFARFVAPGRVVVCQSTRDDQEAMFLRQAFEALNTASDAKGRKLEVITLPMPEPVYYRGEQLPASYANFYIANGSVLVPVFNDKADRRALGILSDLFPDRDVVGVYARDLVVGLGTLHCSTQQQPA
jgi:agmatine deiminase